MVIILILCHNFTQLTWHWQSGKLNVDLLFSENEQRFVLIKQKKKKSSTCILMKSAKKHFNNTIKVKPSFKKIAEMDKYDNLGIIGEGSYGVVIKCKHKQSGQVKFHR